MVTKGYKQTEEHKRKRIESRAGYGHSEITKEKIRLAKKGKKHSENSKRKMSESKKGIRLSQEHINKIKESRRKNAQERGYYHSEETKRKIGEKNKVNTENYWKNNNPTEKQFNFQKQKIPERCDACGIIIYNKNREHNCIEHKAKLRIARTKRIFPAKDTSIEIKIQGFLKQLGITFFTHQYIKIEHGYQCDILIPSMNLVIECDGDYWHKYPTGRDIDKVRTSELLENGFKVLRLWEHEIKVMTLDKFKEKIE